MRIRTYPDISDLIVKFLVGNNLDQQYVDNLPISRRCIGCHRDRGDHDGECELDGFPTGGAWKTSETIKEQIKEIQERYLNLT
jgi:hypothetical protein